LSKKDAAENWCKYTSAHATANGGKPVELCVDPPRCDHGEYELGGIGEDGWRQMSRKDIE